MEYGILGDSTNTGSAAELICKFSAPLTIRNNAPVFSGDSINLKRKASTQGVQRWEVTANISQSVGDASFLIHSALNGNYNDFYVRMPQVANLEYTPETSNVTLNGAVQAGTDTLTISGATKLVPGEFINIGTDPKVYMVTVAGNAGTGIKIFPKLRRAAASGSVVKTGGKVTLLCKQDMDTINGISFSDGILTEIGEAVFVESLK